MYQLIHGEEISIAHHLAFQSLKKPLSNHLVDIQSCSVVEVHPVNTY